MNEKENKKGKWPLLSCRQNAFEAGKHSVSLSLPWWRQQTWYQNLSPPWSRTRVNIYLTNLNSKSGPPYFIRWVCLHLPARMEKHHILWDFSSFQGPSKGKGHWTMTYPHRFTIRMKWAHTQCLHHGRARGWALPGPLSSHRSVDENAEGELAGLSRGHTIKTWSGRSPVTTDTLRFP